MGVNTSAIQDPARLYNTVLGQLPKSQGADATQPIVDWLAQITGKGFTLGHMMFIIICMLKPHEYV